MNAWIVVATVGFVVIAAVLVQGTMQARKQVPVGPWRIEPPASRAALTLALAASLALTVSMVFIDPAFLVIMLAVMLPGWTAYFVRRGLPQVYMWYAVDAIVLGLVLAIVLRETLLD